MVNLPVPDNFQLVMLPIHYFAEIVHSRKTYIFIFLMDIHYNHNNQVLWVHPYSFMMKRIGEMLQVAIMKVAFEIGHT